MIYFLQTKNRPLLIRRRMLYLKLLWSVLAIGFLSGIGYGDESAEDRETESDQVPLVIMAPEGPVLARLRITVDGMPYRLWVARFLGQRIDVDHDGHLTVTELQLIPDRLMQQTQARNHSQALQLSADSKDAESVTAEQFTTWFANQLQRSVNIIAGAVQASEAVRLAVLIDSNGDGCVSVEELSSGTRTLRFRDLDDDQTFTAAELMPYRDPRNQRAAVVPDVANLPFVQLNDAAAVNRVSQQILKRYGDGRNVPLAKFRLPQGAVSETGLTSVETASEEQVRRLLVEAPSHLTIDVQLSEAANNSDLVIDISREAAVFCRSKPDRRGRSALLVDDMPVDIRARGGSRNSRNLMVSFLLQRMSSFDQDRSGYVSEDEFPSLQQELASQIQVNADFDMVDLNGDSMLLSTEVKTFIERDLLATQSRIEVSVQQDGKTLFKLLDVNSDRRLTDRELREGSEILRQYDLNGDQKLSEAELGTAFVLQIGLGQAESLRMGSMASMNMAAQSTDAVLPGVGGLAGPEWFRRMDRNQDRDVSWREFPGPRQMFDQFDTDHDGLLSAQEAEQVEADNVYK